MKILKVAIVNYDKDRGGNRKYNDFVKDELGEGVIFGSEVHQGRTGKTSVRVRPVNIKLGTQKFMMIGRVGAHRWAARRRTKIGRKKTMLISFHGLHKKSNSPDAPEKYQRALAQKIEKYRSKGFEVVAAGDTNERLKKMCEMLGLRGVGHGTLQIFVTPGLKVQDVTVDDFGKQHRMTNHNEVYATIVPA